MTGIGNLKLPRSDLTPPREAADRALRVLRSGSSGKQVARIDRVHVQALLLQLPSERAFKRLAADRWA